MQRRPAPANKSLHPVRVPSLEDVIATAAKPPNPLRPVDSPTLGATAAFSGLNAALQSPCVADSSSDANGVVPSRLMPRLHHVKAASAPRRPEAHVEAALSPRHSSASNATTTSSRPPTPPRPPRPPTSQGPRRSRARWTRRDSRSIAAARYPPERRRAPETTLPPCSLGPTFPPPARAAGRRARGSAPAPEPRPPPPPLPVRSSPRAPRASVPSSA